MSHGYPQPASLMGYGMPVGMGSDFFPQVRPLDSSCGACRRTNTVAAWSFR